MRFPIDNFVQIHSVFDKKEYCKNNRIPTAVFPSSLLKLNFILCPFDISMRRARKRYALTPSNTLSLSLSLSLSPALHSKRKKKEKNDRRTMDNAKQRAPPDLIELARANPLFKAFLHGRLMWNTNLFGAHQRRIGGTPCSAYISLISDYDQSTRKGNGGLDKGLDPSSSSNRA